MLIIRFMAYLIAIIGSLIVILGILTLINNPNKRNNKLFALMAFVIGVWVISNVFVFTSYKLTYPLAYLSYALGALVPPLFFIWSFDFIKFKLNQILAIILILSSIVLFILTLVPNIVLKDHFIVNPASFGYSVILGKYFFVFALYVSLVFIVALIYLFNARKKASGLQKILINYALLGCGIPIIIVIIIDFVIPLLGYVQYGNLDSLASLFFVALISYSITRYRFMDVRIIVRRGAIYFISLLLALILYTYLAIMVKQSIQDYWHLSSGVATFILVALVALGFPPLKNLVEKAVNLSFKGKKSIDLAVKELQDQITKKTDVDTLIELIRKEIGKFLEVEKVKLFVIDPQKKQLVWQGGDNTFEVFDNKNDILRYFEIIHEPLIIDEISHQIEELDKPLDRERLQKAEKEMRKSKISLIMPLYTEDEVFGLITIGQRENNKVYTVQDVQYLETLRDQVSSVLAYALLYRDAMERIKVGVAI